MMDINKVLPQYKETPCGVLIAKYLSIEKYMSALQYKARPDDLFVVSFPKCGTTWVQNIVTCIYKGGNLPFGTASEFFIDSPCIEDLGADVVNNMKRPGAIKTHLPPKLIPWSSEAKYIFVTRNPKDCCVSFYFHTKSRDGYEFKNGTFEDFFELFMEGRTDFGEYYDFLLSWYERRNDPNILFLTYEQLKLNTEDSIMEIASFMGQKYKEMFAVDKDMMHKVIKYTSFNFMKENLSRQIAELPRMQVCEEDEHKEEISFVQQFFNPNAINYMRKGIIGDWKNVMSEEQSRRMDKMFQRKTEGTNIPELWKGIM